MDQTNAPVTTLPDWWPEWMTGPTPMAYGEGHFPLGTCNECGCQQYPMSFREAHFGPNRSDDGCSRWEDPQAPGPRRSVPWSRHYTG